MCKPMNINEFSLWLDSEKVTRGIKYIQLHHTFSPSYKHFKNNHIELHENMKSYHVKTNGWADIAQNITIFPDGKIIVGRPLNKAPAGIYGANKNGICIECVGNFDSCDEMTSSQKEAIIGTIKALLNKFNLTAEKAVTYHAWWSAKGKNLGDYVKGKSVKSCPGACFFGGNKRADFEKNLLPLLKEDDIEVLLKAGIITNKALWEKKKKEDINIFYLLQKTANYIKK